MNPVYVDTSALLPLLDRTDDDHAAVRRALSRLSDDGASLVTTSYTLVEAGALARKRLGVEAFRRLGETIERAARVVWVDESLHRRAWALAGRASRRGPSLVDCVAFLVMERLGLTMALALDEHFRQRGFATLPEAPPGAG